MKACLFAVLIAAFQIAQAQSAWIFSHVVDGDTVAFTAPEFPPGLQKISIRLYGLDTPESGHLAKCDLERKRGLEAKDFVAKLAASGPVLAVPRMWDKYGGRALGDVYVSGESLRQKLLDGGYARPYDGGKRYDWCNGTT